MDQLMVHQAVGVRLGLFQDPDLSQALLAANLYQVLEEDLALAVGQVLVILLVLIADLALAVGQVLEEDLALAVGQVMVADLALAAHHLVQGFLAQLEHQESLVL
jgi:hypothetical protein